MIILYYAVVVAISLIVYPLATFLFGYLFAWGVQAAGGF